MCAITVAAVADQRRAAKKTKARKHAQTVELLTLKLERISDGGVGSRRRRRRYHDLRHRVAARNTNRFHCRKISVN